MDYLIWAIFFLCGLNDKHAQWQRKGIFPQSFITWSQLWRTQWKAALLSVTADVVSWWSDLIGTIPPLKNTSRLQTAAAAPSISWTYPSSDARRDQALDISWTLLTYCSIKICFVLSAKIKWRGLAGWRYCCVSELDFKHPAELRGSQTQRSFTRVRHRDWH